MGRLKLIICTVLISLLTIAHPAASLDFSQQELESAVAELESFFPHVEGYVVSVLEDIVYTDISGSRGLRIGSEMTIYREGEDIIHPVTKQVLGRYENTLAVIRINQIRADYSTGKIIETVSADTVKPGDLVRITSTRLKAGVLFSAPPEEIENPLLSLHNELFMALTKSPRFYPVDVQNQAAVQLPLSKDSIKELAAKDGFDLIILIDGDGLLKNRYLNLKSYSGRTGFLLNSTRILLDTVMKEAGVIPPQQPPATSEKTSLPADRVGKRAFSWESFDLDHQTVSLCYGWLTGNPEGELAVTDGKVIYVYSRHDSQFRLHWKDKGTSLYRVLAIDCGDINGNGLEEIFVTRIGFGMMSSYVLEYQGDTFIKRARNTNLFYRIIKTGGNGARLFAQKFNADTTFKKPVIEYISEGERYIPKDNGVLKVPDIFGFGLADIDGNGDREIILLNDDEHISIYQPSGKKIWTSEQSFGGSSLFVDSETLGQYLPGDEPGGMVIKGRIMGVDIDNDNRHELVLFRNIPKLGSFFKNLRVYDRSHIALYRWDGMNMVTLSQPDKLSGYLSDYAVAIYPDGHAELIIALDETSSRIRKGTGKILTRSLTNQFSEF